MAEKRDGANLAEAMSYLATEPFVLNKVQSVRNEIPAASNALPKEAGTAVAGTATEFSRGDHVHPAETRTMSQSLPAERFPVKFNFGSRNYQIDSNGHLEIRFSPTLGLDYREVWGVNLGMRQVEVKLGILWQPRL